MNTYQEDKNMSDAGTPGDALDAILARLGRDHLQQLMARDAHPKGSPEWHRHDQGRWAFKEAALIVDRATGYRRDIYGAWLKEWSPCVE